MAPSYPYLLIPAKSPEHAKTRLKGVLDNETRKGLVYAMITDLLAAVNQSRLPDDHIWVITSDPDIQSLAASYKAEIIPDRTQSLNAAIEYGIHQLQTVPANEVLILPIDIPLIQPDDIDQLKWLVNQLSPPFVYLTPSYSGGTNLLYFSPPSLITPQFGWNSCRLHMEEAVRKGCTPMVYSAPTIQLDIDTPDDLHVFLNHKLAFKTHTFQFLKSARRDLFEDLLTTKTD